MSGNRVAAAVFVCFFSGLAGTASAGPISALYLTGEYGEVFVVRGDSVAESWTSRTDRQQVIAVTDVVRTMGSYSGDAGGEYTLDGQSTGTTYSFPLGGGCFFDGATSGTVNYAWDFCGGAAYSFDAEWANPVQLFRLGIQDFSRLGITFDASDD